MILIAVICCVLVATNAAVVPSDMPKISPLAAPLALSGYTDCGVSKIVDITLSGCTSAPCQLTAGQTYNLGIDFSPRDMHWDLKHRAILMKEAQLVELSEGPVADSTVYPGQNYRFDYSFVASGISGAGEFRLTLQQNYVHEVCVVIPVTI